MPKDPWSNDYVYISPGTNSDFDIISYGADGVPGGENEHMDINNWDNRIDPSVGIDTGEIDMSQLRPDLRLPMWNIWFEIMWNSGPDTHDGGRFQRLYGG